ncbi:MAG TPA: sigma-70 family RNA polymerase sigma factor [Roseimicrobium sp.]|nr:sigma-70 family RNA polymerase sigma factor [Roseimicrobium sp.]
MIGPFGTSTDEQCMWRVQQDDDPAAFARLVTRWETPIRRLCERMLCDAHRGEDVAQEAFARVFARRKDFQPTGKFSTWLWRIAINLCHDELRRRKRRPEHPIEDEEGETVIVLATNDPGPDAQIVSQERAAVVRRALQEMPEHLRAVLVLRHYEDLKFREIADVLGIPEGTVKSRMFEALNQMEQRLSALMKGDAMDETDTGSPQSKATL